MQLATLFKGMLMSQGYVTTPQRLREVAPEALPAPRTDGCAERTAEAPDHAGLERWRLAFPAGARSRTLPRPCARRT